MDDEELLSDNINEQIMENLSLPSSAISTDSPVKNVCNNINEMKQSNHNSTLQNMNKHNKIDNKLNKNKYYDYKNNINNFDTLFKLLNEKDQTIIEKEHELSVLHDENKNLMVENVNLEMRMEYLRLELSRIKQQTEPKLSSPVGNKTLFMNAWKTPIKNNLLKTPTSNRKLSNTQSYYDSDVDSSDISDDFFLNTNGNILNESKCEKSFHNTTLCSNEPLIPKNKQFAKRAKRVFMNIITCDRESSSDITICSNTTEDQQIKRLISFKKFKKVNKISPAIVTSILRTPNNPIKRNVSFSNAKTSVIPMMLINTPTPDENNLTPKNQTTFTKSAFQRRIKISTVSFQTKAMQNSTLKKNKCQRDEENLDGQDNLHVAATYLDDIIEKSQKIKNILERKL